MALVFEMGRALVAGIVRGYQRANAALEASQRNGAVPNAWKPFSPPGGGYSVLMPYPPYYKSGPLQAGTLKLQLNTYVAEGPDEAFVVGYCDTPRPMSLRAALAGLDATVSTRGSAAVRMKSVRPVRLGLYPGREMEATQDTGAAVVTTRWRTYLAPQRMFICTATSLGTGPTPDRARRFLDSFRILSEAWNRFTPPGGGFSVFMPHPPPHTTSWLGQSTRVLLHQYIAGTSWGRDAYSVTYQDSSVPIAPDRLQTVLDQLPPGHRQVGHARWIRLGAYRGREVQWVKKVRNTDFQYRRRAYVVGRRVYHVLVTTVVNDSASFPPETQRFLDSFKLSTDAAPSAGR